ncbi:hypothetical protein [Peribacillus simplex]
MMAVGDMQNYFPNGGPTVNNGFNQKYLAELILLTGALAEARSCL